MKEFSNNNEHPRLMLVFTRGMSLGAWDRLGMLDREVELYKRLSPRLGGISFLTYGGTSESRYKERLGNITIITNDRGHTPTVYSILAPVIHRTHFRNSDVIKTNQIDGAWTAILGKLLYRKRVIVRCGYLWSVIQKKRYKNTLSAHLAYFLEKLSLKMADSCVVATEEQRKYIEREHRIKNRKIKVIPNFIDTESFKRLREIDKEPNLICFVGRLSPEKNVNLLFEACCGKEHLKLLIIGDGPLRDDLRQMAQRFGLDVEFHRSIANSKLPEELNRAKVFILPSSYEGCPKALLEAMACELPVIGTNVEGIHEIIRNGDNGILCEKTADGLKDAIAAVLNDGALSYRIAKNARRYVVEHHSLEQVIEMELEVLRDCLSSGKSSKARVYRKGGNQ